MFASVLSFLAAVKMMHAMYTSARGDGKGGDGGRLHPNKEIENFRQEVTVSSCSQALPHSRGIPWGRWLCPATGGQRAPDVPRNLAGAESAQASEDHRALRRLPGTTPGDNWPLAHGAAGCDWQCTLCSAFQVDTFRWLDSSGSPPRKAQRHIGGYWRYAAPHPLVPYRS